MTRHGTLAYYLAAWVIGCFIVSLLGWLLNAFSGESTVKASMLLLAYFFALIFGAVDTLLFAFLLRRLMRWWGTEAVWIWLATGAAVSFFLIMVLVRADNAWLASRNPPGGATGLLFEALLMAPNALERMGLWQVPVEGAATAAVLCLVDRAFNRPGDPAKAGPSPA